MQATSSTPDLRKRQLVSAKPTTKWSAIYQIFMQVLAASPPEQLPSLTVFGAAIPHLWSIWECLILSEPILIFGTSPTMTSQAIWWLRDFLRPVRTRTPSLPTLSNRVQMPLAGDFRPYFTIHDKDHAALVNQNAPQAGLLLGVTNPFYDGTCKHWPHRLSLGDPSRFVLQRDGNTCLETYDGLQYETPLVGEPSTPPWSYTRLEDQNA